jgi:hypothetical protein
LYFMDQEVGAVRLTLGEQDGVLRSPQMSDHLPGYGCSPRNNNSRWPSVRFGNICCAKSEW